MRVRSSHRVSSLVILALLSLSAPSSAATCWTKDELVAYQLRALQTMLSVITLQCNAMGVSAMNDSYGRFVRVMRPALRGSVTALTTHFRRDAGPHAQSALDEHITKMANLFSSAPASAEACAKGVDIADRAANATPEEFTRMAASMMPDPEGEKLCQAE